MHIIQMGKNDPNKSTDGAYSNIVRCSMLRGANRIGRAKSQIGQRDQNLDARGGLSCPGASQIALCRRDVNKCSHSGLEGLSCGRIGLLGGFEERIRCFPPALRRLQIRISRPDFVFNLIPGKRYFCLRLAALCCCADQLVASSAAVEKCPIQVQLRRVGIDMRRNNRIEVLASVRIPVAPITGKTERRVVCRPGPSDRRIRGAEPGNFG